MRKPYNELARCCENPSYFIHNYVDILNPKYGKIKFNLFPFQESLLKNFEDYRFNIILKARQMGISTTICAYVLWLAASRRNENILLVSSTLQAGKLLLARISEMFNSLPEWLKKDLDIFEPESHSKRQMILSNGSRIAVTVATETAFRGEFATLIVFDEVAHVDDFETVWNAAWPTISSPYNNSRVIVSSSPNGTRKFFHELWKNATSRGFNTTELPWFIHPERSQSWFDDTTKSMTDVAIAQELLCSFAAK